jgi:hypothetical protein
MLLARHMATSTRNIVTDLLSLETETATGVCARLTHRQCKVTACAAALCTAAISRREEVVSPVCSYSNRICYLMYDVPNIHLESACHLKSMGEELDRQAWSRSGTHQHESPPSDRTSSPGPAAHSTRLLPLAVCFSPCLLCLGAPGPAAGPHEHASGHELECWEL